MENNLITYWSNSYAFLFSAVNKRGMNKTSSEPVLRRSVSNEIYDEILLESGDPNFLTLSYQDLNEATRARPEPYDSLPDEEDKVNSDRCSTGEYDERHTIADETYNKPDLHDSPQPNNYMVLQLGSEYELSTSQITAASGT